MDDSVISCPPCRSPNVCITLGGDCNLKRPTQGAMHKAQCTICDPRPEATFEECDKWPGHYKGCMYKDEGKPINGWVCDGKGNLTRADSSPTKGD